MVRSHEHFLEEWNVNRAWHPYGVHLSIIIFHPELECSYFLDVNTRSYSFNLVVSLKRLEVAVKLVCTICLVISSPRVVCVHDGRVAVYEKFSMPRMLQLADW